ncbi:MAG: hypothetical protein ABJO27_09370 [Pseudoruegeria sp.]
MSSHFSHFERRQIAERTLEGLAAARKDGRIGGRAPALSPDQKVEMIRMREINVLASFCRNETSCNGPSYRTKFRASIVEVGSML